LRRETFDETINRSGRQPSSVLTLKQIIDEIKRLGTPKSLDGMSRFGIQANNAFGVSIPQLRNLAKKTGTSHEVAQQLWKTGYHEARILATMIDDPVKVTRGQMEEWALGFDSWDVVDNCCGNLFDKTPFAVPKPTNGQREGKSTSREQASS
jgi:3-methyladenine DNA glycosylase AlkD